MKNHLHRLHLGAGDVRFPGWFNLDLRRGYDLRHGLPDWAAGSVEAVYSCHLLEHLTYDEDLRLLEEIERVLCAGGVLRVGVPDVRLFAAAYVQDDLAFTQRYFRRYVPPADPHSERSRQPIELPDYLSFGSIAGLLAIVYGWGHRSLHDEEVLRALLRQAGFRDDHIRRTGFGESAWGNLGRLDRHFDDHTLFVEARK